MSITHWQATASFASCKRVVWHAGEHPGHDPLPPLTIPPMSSFSFYENGLYNGYKTVLFRDPGAYEFFAEVETISGKKFKSKSLKLEVESRGDEEDQWLLASLRDFYGELSDRIHSGSTPLPDTFEFAKFKSRVARANLFRDLQLIDDVGRSCDRIRYYQGTDEQLDSFIRERIDHFWESDDLVRRELAVIRLAAMAAQMQRWQVAKVALDKLPDESYPKMSVRKWMEKEMTPDK
jgi:hypothetical protein